MPTLRKTAVKLLKLQTLTCSQLELSVQVLFQLLNQGKNSLIAYSFKGNKFDQSQWVEY